MTLLRFDPAQRRRQILDAAEDIFELHGVHAPLDLVAAHAGVRRAALDRLFPERAALMAALMMRALEAFERAARDLDAHDDALAVLLHDVADHMALSAPLVLFWRDVDPRHPAITEADQRTLAVLMPLVRRAIAAGRCRADVDEAQLLLAFDMLSGCVRGQDIAERRRLAHDSARLMIHALGLPSALAVSG